MKLSKDSSAPEWNYFYINNNIILSYINKISKVEISNS